MKLMVSAAVAALAFAALPAQAAVLYSYAGPYGPVESPGAASFGAFSGGTSGALSFTVDGYASLDGANCCTDVFHLNVNGSDVLVLTRALGGGGADIDYTNTVGAVIGATYWRGNGYSFDVTIASLPLLVGANSFDLSYTGAAQGLGDEGWGLRNILLTGKERGAVPEPTSWALMLGGLGLVGTALRRRKVAVSFG